MLKTIAAIVAGASLLTCLGTPFAYFYGGLTEQTFQWLFALASLTWFIGATIFVSRA
jgi:hypothetical protein